MKCFLFFHRYGHWYVWSRSDEHFFYARQCAKCGKVQMKRERIEQ